jgi:hypothetical protein
MDLRLRGGHLKGSGCGAEDPGLMVNGEYDGKVFAGLQTAQRGNMISSMRRHGQS